MKSVSVLAIGRLRDIVTQGVLHRSLHKKLSQWGRRIPDSGKMLQINFTEGFFTMYSVFSYIAAIESLERYYASQDGCAHIKLRHRIRAGLVTVNFFLLTVLMIFLILSIGDFILDLSLWFTIPIILAVGCCGAFLAFLLGKIRSLYILSIFTLLFIGLFLYAFGFWRDL